MSNYKDIQKKFKKLANKVTVLWVSPKRTAPLDLGIKQFKRNNPDPTDRQIYKQNVWKSIKPAPTNSIKKKGR